MPVCVAFLRAINVTGRFLKMSELASAFQQLGYADARTHINSGNVIFSTAARSLPRLEQDLQQRLEPLLGFRSEAFVRSVPQVRAIAERAGRLLPRVVEGGDVNVCFLQAPLDAAQAAALEPLKTELDDFEIGEREVYWICRMRQSDSRFSNAVLERKLQLRSTLRRARMLDGLAGAL